tara:strand:+ start:2218 stop:2505 length:288 start_codon:yes stop_codon:yes gene_type:complete
METPQVQVGQWYAVGCRTDNFILITKIGNKFVSCDLYTSEKTNIKSDQNGTEWEISPSTSTFVKKTRKAIKPFEYAAWGRPMAYNDITSNGWSMD